LSASETQPDADGRALPKTHWHVEQLHVDASPLVADGRVFVGSCVGDVYGAPTLQAVAVDAAGGKVLWRRPSDTPFPNAPAYAQGAVLFGLANGKLDQEAAQPRGGLLCLDAATGERRWELATPGSVLCTPAVQGERAYFTCRDGQVRCVRVADGQLAWARDLGDPLVASPVVAGDDVYVLSVSGILACLSAATGEVRWRLEQLFTPDNDTYSSPVLAGGRLYAAIGGKLHCLGAPQHRDSPPHLSVR
jgi:outer membrane protein assembly factor BamB